MDKLTPKEKLISNLVSTKLWASMLAEIAIIIALFWCIGAGRDWETITVLITGLVSVAGLYFGFKTKQNETYMRFNSHTGPDRLREP